MSRPRCAAKPGRQPRLFDKNRAIMEIEFAWPKEQIDSCISAKFLVCGMGPGIFLKIRARLELQRINENAARDFPILSSVLTRDPKQLQMSAMQRTPRRHQDGLAHSLTPMRTRRPRWRHDLHWT